MAKDKAYYEAEKKIQEALKSGATELDLSKRSRKIILYDDRSRINAAHIPKIIRIPDRLEASTAPYDMNLPG